MITWEELGEDGGVMIYQRIDQDGLVRVTAVRGYSELEEYLTSLEEENN
jgi:hypothetical protein